MAKSTDAQVQSSDRLSFTVFLAAAVHALIILGISFTVAQSDQVSPTMEITLATHKSKREPETADFLAQHNQEASGTKDKAEEITVDQTATMADTQVREVQPQPQVKATDPSKRQQQLITTTGDNHLQASKNLDQEEEQEKQQGLLEDQVPVSAEIASLQAKLDRQRQAYAKKPRIRRLTSVATKSSYDAEYLQKWSSKVELVGNDNYPKKALSGKIFGNLRLAAIILPSGAIKQVEILQSSGHKILDVAALQIVRLASPFQPFPNEIRQQADQLEIIRTWRFEITGLSTSGE